VISSCFYSSFSYRTQNMYMTQTGAEPVDRKRWETRDAILTSKEKSHEFSSTYLHKKITYNWKT